MPSTSNAIDEIEDRLHDLIDALRDADSPQLAEIMEAFGKDFTLPTSVRRSVNGIRDQLERWRKDPLGLPDSPKVMIAANRLEDACAEALAAGVIAPAKPTFASQWRRLLAIALITALCGCVTLLIPIVLLRLGVDLSDPAVERTTRPVVLPRGDEGTATVLVPVTPLVPASVVGLEVIPVGDCKQTLRNDSTCSETEARLWPEGRIKTYEIKLAHQAYGLLFSIAEAEVDTWGVGAARVLLAATDETPEGRYEIPLTAAYLGYTPQRCAFLQRLQGTCPSPRTGKGEKHSGNLLPILVVNVTPGDPSRRLGEKRVAEAEAAEAKRKAEERSVQIGAAVVEIRAVLKETEKILARRRWAELRIRVGKLGSLFDPLDALVVSHADAELIPAEVEEVRARYEALHQRVQAFDEHVFEQTFAAVTADKNRSVLEAQLLQRIASQNGITAQDVDDIYTGHADEIARRIAAKQQAHIDALKAAQAKLEQRCGPLPKDSWNAVNTYVQALPLKPHVEIEMGECMTPRLTEKECWEVRCDYKLKVEVAIERPKVVTPHKANFFLVNDRVVRHLDD